MLYVCKAAKGLICVGVSAACNWPTEENPSCPGHCD